MQNIQTYNPILLPMLAINPVKKCHANEFYEWKKSDHYISILPPNDSTVKKSDSNNVILHLPDKKTPSYDWLYWIENTQNWNTMCATCHSTNLRKNYDIKTDSYKTSYSI